MIQIMRPPSLRVHSPFVCARPTTGVGGVAAANRVVLDLALARRKRHGRTPIHWSRHPRGVAQLAEHRSPKPGVAGSSPAAPASLFEVRPRWRGAMTTSNSIISPD